MTDKSRRDDREDEPLSLHGMTPEEALKRALGTPLPESVKQAEREAEDRDGE